MSLDFKVVEKGQPGVAGGGEKKFYAQIVLGKECTIDELVKEIEKFSALSEPDIRGVILGLENVIQTKLAECRPVRLDKLGSFYPTLSSQGELKEENVDIHSVRDTNVNYRAGDRIRKALSEAGLKKIKPSKQATDKK